ncbi:uncharacterized protein NPIL_317531 [Nephila pilipes]|uniref:Uncharacterized protein n=1 Tax=Nephila pilipes TaxID=299642 RepID=A0A8X6IVW8_NEPPI|nr:uncharacterized protein NPIL_317531 [Nephila pilipes]
MSTDLKLDMFAFQLFEAYWYKAKLLPQKIGVTSMYPDEYHLDRTDVYEESHYIAVCVKELFYRQVFLDEISVIHPLIRDSPLYLSDYLSSAFGRDGFYRDQTVFELLFTTCAFVLRLCRFSFENGHKNIINYAHMCWAIYFDEYKYDFYGQGGWTRLKIVADSYILPNESLDIFPNKINVAKQVPLLAKKAVDNYKAFTSAFSVQCKTISKAWVKFQLQNLAKLRAANHTMKDEALRDPKDIEQFLLQFRRLCNPNSSEMLKYLSRSTLSTSYKPCEQSNKTIFGSLLKLSHLTLNDTIVDSVIRQREIESSSKERDNQSDKMTAVDLSLNKKDEDQTDEIIPLNLSQINEIKSKTIENDSSRNASFSIKQIASNEESSMDKTRHAIDQKLNENTRKEIDLERESPEVKCLLRMILVLGNTEGITDVLSSLPHSDTHQSKKKSKT